MVETSFDVINIEYQYESDFDEMNPSDSLLDWDADVTVSVDVPDEFKDKDYTWTEDLIRDSLKTHISQRLEEPVVVVDFTAFYAGTNDPLRGNYEDYEAETFEAKEKKIGSIRIVKNPNFPSGTSLQAYIKTNRAELRKVFGNPNMGESGDGKSKGKEWNLIVGPHRVTIYDYREKGKKGTKYFNIGGSGKYGALLVAQALSIHRNERVYAKETVPKWLEDKGHHQQVKSIDEHPDLTYERAKEYEDNRRRYRAETDLGFKEWADQELKTHGKKESFDDWLDDELDSHGDDITLEDWGHHELDSHYERYGAESFEDFKRKMVGDNFIAGDVGYMEALEDFYAEYLEEFEEITDEFCPKPETFEEFQERVLKNDYEMSLEAENWGGDPKGQLATALRNARIKAKQPKKPLKIEKLGAEDNIKRFKVGEQYTHRYYHGYGFSDYEVMRRTDKSVWFSKVNPETGKVDSPLLVSRHKLHTMQPFEHDGEIIDGLEMVRLQMGYPVKAGQTTTTKYAETSGQWEIGEQLEEAQMNAEDQNTDLLKWIEDYLWDNDKKGYQAYHAHRKSLGLNAEGKKRKKISGVLSDPFDELSLDSGGIKIGIVALAAIGLTIFGINKLRK